MLFIFKLTFFELNYYIKRLYNVIKIYKYIQKLLAVKIFNYLRQPTLQY